MGAFAVPFLIPLHPCVNVGLFLLASSDQVFINDSVPLYLLYAEEDSIRGRKSKENALEILVLYTQRFGLFEREKLRG